MALASLLLIQESQGSIHRLLQAALGFHIFELLCIVLGVEPGSEFLRIREDFEAALPRFAGKPTRAMRGAAKP
jgi:hypothetical protein